MSLARLQVKVGGMACSFCVETITRGLSRTPGVAEVSVSLAHEEALILYDPARATAAGLSRTLQSLGFRVLDPRRARSGEEEAAELARARDRLAIAGSAAWVALLAMLLMWTDRPYPYSQWIVGALAALTVLGPGLPILRMAWASARRRIPNQHVLMELAAAGGVLGGAAGLLSWRFPAPDFFGVAVFVTAYHLLGGYTSLLVRTRASRAVRRLLSLQPATARVVRGGEELELPVEAVAVGDLVRVRPGEQIPVDGRVEEGSSAVDERLVTGEPLPRDVGPGQAVIGGSLCRLGTLLVRVSRVGEESFLRQVARHMEEARALKPGLLLLLDRVLRWFVPAVLAVAALTLLGWTAGRALAAGAADWPGAVFATLAVLVMGYPCALGMATPLAMIRGGGEAARQGILMRSAASFQALRRVDVVVFDKTGTLTRGEPRVSGVHPAPGWDEPGLLGLAASAEQVSEHPLGQAIVRAARARGLALDRAERFESVPGLGVRAGVGGRSVLVGSLRFLGGEGAATGALEGPAAALEALGQTVMAVAADGRPAGLLAVADSVKPDAAAAVAELRRLGLRPAMLTGDNPRTARAVAAELGIEDVMAQVLPQDKAERLRALQRAGHRVAMVGDGINDGPALTQADVGIALGAGADVAIEAADVVLVGPRLQGVVDAYHVARRTHRKTVQNLALAFSFNGVGVPLAALGWVEPVWAMAAMAASVTAVLANSFWSRLVPRRPAPAPAGRLVLRVPSIHCEGCVTALRGALLRVPGVEAVEGDAGARRLVVALRGPGGGREALEAAIVAAGHVVEDGGEGES
jgi:heavy metal translocating P-type ATPase